jgi:hypothetical protein
MSPSGFEPKGKRESHYIMPHKTKKNIQQGKGYENTPKNTLMQVNLPQTKGS